MSDESAETTGDGGGDLHLPDQLPERLAKRRSRTTFISVAVGLAMALILGGGGYAYAQHRAEVAQQHREQVAVAKKAEAKRAFEAARKARLQREAKTRRAAAVEYQSCRDQVDPFLKDLKTVNARLNVGITESTFSELVGSASVSHDDLDAPALVDIVQGNCLAAAGSLETALNKYIVSANTWNDCLYEDDYCTTDSIDPQLQRNWSAATRLIERAERKLDSADPAVTQAGSDSGSDVT
jgi:hypothetical protein